MNQREQYLTIVGKVGPELHKKLNLAGDSNHSAWFITDYSPINYAIGALFYYGIEKFALDYVLLNGVHKSIFIDSGYKAVCLFSGRPTLPAEILALPYFETFVYNPESITVFKCPEK